MWKTHASYRALPSPESRLKVYPYSQPSAGGKQRRTRGQSLLITPSPERNDLVEGAYREARRRKQRVGIRTLKGRRDETQGMTAWSPGNPRGNKTPIPKLLFQKCERGKRRIIKNKVKNKLHLPESFIDFSDTSVTRYSDHDQKAWYRGRSIPAAAF